ncbi:hypothetical protein V8G54_031415, partial [Vigna mungo]
KTLSSKWVRGESERHGGGCEGLGTPIGNSEPPFNMGFMSHCGWNSCTETFSMGVPIATWHIHSDQPRNATLVTEVLKVGLVVKDWSQRNASVIASNVENCVRRLMQTKEGEEMREREREQ